MKVVQTVGCSTFTHEAKPATRRVADGERMNPRGRVARSRQYRGDVEHQGDERLKSVQAGAPPPCPVPRAYGLVGPAVSPPDVLHGRGRIFPAPARGNPAPHGRHAINVPLATVMRGLSRSVAGTFQRRSGRY